MPPSKKKKIRINSSSALYASYVFRGRNPVYRSYSMQYTSSVRPPCTNSNSNFTFKRGQGSSGTSIICPHDLSLSIIHYSKPYRYQSHRNFYTNFLCQLYTLRQTLDINLMATFTRPPFNVTIVGCKHRVHHTLNLLLSQGSATVVPPDAKVEVTVKNLCVKY
jgi:hypothetical protein